MIVFETLPPDVLPSLRWVLMSLCPPMPEWWTSDEGEYRLSVHDIWVWWITPRAVLFDRSLAASWADPEWLEICVRTYTECMTVLAVDLTGLEAA